MEVHDAADAWVCYIRGDIDRCNSRSDSLDLYVKLNSSQLFSFIGANVEGRVYSVVPARPEIGDRNLGRDLCPA